MIYLKVRILLALLMMFIMTILPLPEMFTGFRPPWVLLFVLYLQLLLPRYFNLIFLFLIGLCLDVLSSAVLGEHAFALVLTTWLASTKTRRFEFFSLGQQMAYIILFCCTYQFVIVLVDAFLGYHYDLLSMVVSAFIGMLLWPWIRLLADSLFRVKKIRAF
jgi:rod shape-determining protein MreD